MPSHQRMAILASGQGSNMEAIAKACARGEIDAEVALVVCNDPQAAVLEKARALDLERRCIPHQQFASREDFEATMMAEIDHSGATLVVLAGFMRILTSTFVREYCGSLLNIHPSLLPKYPGLHTHQRALDAGDCETGATVHFVTPELDAGPTIVQARIPVLAGDDASALAHRTLAQEHRIYPLAVRWCTEGRVELRADKAWMDGEALGEYGATAESATNITTQRNKT